MERSLCYDQKCILRLRGAKRVHASTGLRYRTSAHPQVKAVFGQLGLVSCSCDVSCVTSRLTSLMARSRWQVFRRASLHSQLRAPVVYAACSGWWCVGRPSTQRTAGNLKRTTGLTASGPLVSFSLPTPTSRRAYVQDAKAHEGDWNLAGDPCALVTFTSSKKAARAQVRRLFAHKVAAILRK